jgi:uncharacterized protein (UPF0332 family)
MEAINLARNLPRLRSARKNADYKLNESFTLVEARDALKVAAATVDGAKRAAERCVGQQA